MPQVMQGAPGEAPAGDQPAVRGRDLALVLLITAGLLFLVRTQVRDQPRTAEFVLAMLALQSAIPVAAIYAVIVRMRGVPWSALGLRAAPWRWIFGAALLTIPVLPLVAYVNYLAQSLSGGPVRNPQIDILGPVAMSGPGFAGLLVMAGIVAPIVEELVFRGLFFGWLRARLGVAAGVVLSAAGFALAHGIPILMPALFVHGMILALVYQRSGSLWPPIVMHGLFNAIMLAALYAALSAGVLPQAVGR
jgi:membrane protease YdiL (CAAX protease family)